jgi:hypothetical protein
VPFTDSSRLLPLAAMGRQWLELWQRAGVFGRGGLDAAAAFYEPWRFDPRRLRTLWLTELTHAMDRYMRSPAFLQLMQYNLSALAGSPYLGTPLSRR